MTIKLKCIVCDGEFQRSNEKGRLPTYCSETCKTEGKKRLRFAKTQKTQSPALDRATVSYVRGLLRLGNTPEVAAEKSGMSLTRVRLIQENSL